MDQYELCRFLRPKIFDILKEIPLDRNYGIVTQSLIEVLRSNDDFEYIECTIEVTTRKKGKLISVYNQEKYKDWLNRVIELPSNWDLSKLFYNQMLYCRIYLDKYEYDRNTVEKDASNLEKGYLYIRIDHATARKYTCDCLKENRFYDDRLGMKPYKNIFFYNPLQEYFYIQAPDYIWHTKVKFCPCCGTKTNYKE